MTRVVKVECWVAICDRCGNAVKSTDDNAIGYTSPEDAIAGTELLELPYEGDEEYWGLFCDGCTEEVKGEDAWYGYLPKSAVCLHILHGDEHIIEPD